MYRNMFRLSFLFILLLLIISCVIDIEEPIQESLSIELLEIDYNQIENQLYLQIEVVPGNEVINEVFVTILSNSFDSTVFLNDSATSGDLIPQNNQYSAFTEVDLPFEDYQFNAVVHTLSSREYSKRKNITIEKQFPPEISDIIFWQKNADGSGTIFDPNSEAFMVDNEEYNYLDFQVVINDPNGLDDIRYVQYQINVESMAAEDSCNYEPELGFLSYPQWYLEYQETTDTGYVFDVNNAYLDEPGIPIKPIGICGRIGVSIFRFIIADMTSGPVVEDRSVEFDK